MILFSLAEVQRRKGNLTLARRQLERVVAIDDASLGPDDPEVGADLEALAAVLRALGDLESAETAEARARSIAQAATAAPAGP